MQDYYSKIEPRLDSPSLYDMQGIAPLTLLSRSQVKSYNFISL